MDVSRVVQEAAAAVPQLPYQQDGGLSQADVVIGFLDFARLVIIT